MDSVKNEQKEKQKNLGSSVGWWIMRKDSTRVGRRGVAANVFAGEGLSYCVLTATMF